MPQRTCSIDGCDRPHSGRGWCAMHYSRWQRTGDPLQARAYSPRAGVDASDEDRFWPKVSIPADPLQCWLWTASVDPDTGYGRFRINGTTGYAHRVAYELSFGAVPPSLELDHHCRVPSCVNPVHLEAVSASVNNRRREVALVAHCPQGHPYLGDNVYEYGGRRYCRACKTEHVRAHRKRKREAA